MADKIAINKENAKVSRVAVTGDISAVVRSSYKLQKLIQKKHILLSVL